MSDQYIVRRDGDKWFATSDDFTNLQECDVEWGDTAQEAFNSLMSEIMTRKVVDENVKNDYKHIPKKMIDPKYLGARRTYEIEKAQNL